VNPYAALPGRPDVSPFKLRWDGEPQQTVPCPACLQPAVWWSEPGCSDGISHLIVCTRCEAINAASKAADVGG
jgi:hypothetical protein